MDLDNEENYFTRRMNRAIKDKDVENAEKELRKYIYEDTQFINYNKLESDFDKFCYNHCKCIETILNELKYREEKNKELREEYSAEQKAELKEKEKLKNKNNELLRKLKNRVKEVKKLTKYSLYKKEFSRLNKQLEKKDKIIDKLLTEITAVNSGRYEYMDNEEVLNIFTKKVEE